MREELIESRRLVTNRAIVDTVVSQHPRSVLDVGCGEGWLVRALAERRIRCTGVDVVPELIDEAARLGGGDFRVASYEMIAGGVLGVRADVVACNFSLLGGESVDRLIRSVPAVLLEPGGTLVIQTLHPVIACGDDAYADGWREGSWTGVGPGFGPAAPWYFRTLESWVRLLYHAGLALHGLREPVHPSTGRPVSVIFEARVAG